MGTRWVVGFDMGVSLSCSRLVARTRARVRSRLGVDRRAPLDEGHRWPPNPADDAAAAAAASANVARRARHGHVGQPGGQESFTGVTQRGGPAGPPGTTQQSFSAPQHSLPQHCSWLSHEVVDPHIGVPQLPRSQ